jgi:predicted transcriptional regulator
MRRQGYKVEKIAEVVGVTRQTVHRHSKGLRWKPKP